MPSDEARLPIDSHGPVEPEREAFEREGDLGTASTAIEPEKGVPAPRTEREDNPPQVSDESSGKEVAALQATIKALEVSNEKLAAAVQDRWQIPKVVFGLLMAAFTFWAGVNLFSEFLAVSQLRSRADELNKAVERSNNLNTELATTIATSKSELTTALTDHSKEMEAKKQELDDGFRARGDELSGQLQSITDLVEMHGQEIASMRSDYDERIANADHAFVESQRVAAFLNLARDQLFYRENPTRAVWYAGKAKDALDMLLRTQPALKEPFREIQADVLSLHAECWLQLEQWDQLKATVDEFKSSKACATCFETFYYEGMYHLSEAVYNHEGLGRVAERQKSIQLAVASFRRAIEPGIVAQAPVRLRESHVAKLFLIACVFDTGDLAECSKLSSEFRRSFQSRESVVRLTPQRRAQQAVAEAWWRLASFAMGAEEAIAEFDCDLDLGSVGRVEGQFLVKLLEKAARHRSEYVQSSKLWQEWAENRFGVYAITIARAIERASACSSNDKQVAASCPACEVGGSFSSERGPNKPILPTDLTAFDLSVPIDLPRVTERLSRGDGSDRAVVADRVTTRQVQWGEHVISYEVIETREVNLSETEAVKARFDPAITTPFRKSAEDLPPFEEPPAPPPMPSA